MNNFNFANQNETSINKINCITKVYIYENIKCFSIDALKRMEQYTQTIKDLNFDIFKIILKKNKILVFSNKNFEKGTFINNMDMMNLEKIKIMKQKKEKDFSGILLYKYRVHKYDRFLKVL